LHELRQQLASAGDKLAGFLRPLAEAAPDGRAKLYVTWRLLQLRKDYPGLFSVGEYQPLSASGDKAAHLFAFARQRAGTKALVAVPRLSTRLNPDADRAPLGEMAWGATQLPLKGLEAVPKWKNVFTASILTPKDGKLLAVELFTHFPVAVLLSDE
jgi:(1->4)-alpha-D-glucan 1-alpha-D-glucosylmutase